MKLLCFIHSNFTFNLNWLQKEVIILNLDILKNKSKLSEILSIIKFSIVVFICIIFLLNFYGYWNKIGVNPNREYSIYSATLCLCVVMLITLGFLLSNTKIRQSKDEFRLSWLIENIFFITITSLPIYIFTAYESEYKYIFLLIILSSTIQYGCRYGIITSCICSVITLIADLIYVPTVDGINYYFQKDIITVGLFIFIAWILGYYVDMEFENNKRKDAELKVLHSKLTAKNKERKIIEEFLYKNQICYEVIFENSIRSIIVHNKGKIIYANESAAILLGHETPLELEENSIYDYYKGNTSSIKNKYSDILNNELSKVTWEEKILNKKGEAINVENTSFFIIYKGNPCIITFLIDLSKEKQIETLKHDVENKVQLLNESIEFNTVLTEFFTNMSHELKTPVNVIYVAIQTINMYLNNCKDCLNNESLIKCKSYLEIMRQNCHRMIRLINNLMDITKIDSGFLKPTMKNRDIISFIEDIVQSISLYINSKDIELIFDTNVEEKIMAFDSEKIERVILNLLSNAFKFTNNNGHIYVDIEDKCENIIITVKDNGVGIPEDKLDIIFERFGQANRSLSRMHEGTGIGLYLVKSFVEMHEGTISVSSVEGQGTEFRIVLPVKVNENEELTEDILISADTEKINIEFSDVYSNRA